MNRAVYNTLIRLCVDICKRNRKWKLLWFADKERSLNYEPKADEMVITVHRWFANKSCPGDWLYARLGDVAAKVIAKLGGGTVAPGTSGGWYRVRKNWADSKSQIGAYKDLENAKACVDKNTGYTVFDESGKAIYPSAVSSSDVPYVVRVGISNLNIRKGPGTDYGKTKYILVGTYTIVEESDGQGTGKWGRLKSGAGWISLDYCVRV